MKAVHKNNHAGSAVVEVTLIMSMVLVIVFLILTMMLGVWKQAEIHADLMAEIGEDADHPADVIHKEVSGERVIYSQTICVSLVQGYAVKSREYQVERRIETEQRLRRWQLFGNLLSE